MPNGPWPAQLTDLIRSTPGWDSAMRWHYALLLNNMWHNDCKVRDDLGDIADLSGLNRARNWREKAEKLRFKLVSMVGETGEKLEYLTHPRLVKDAEKTNKQSELQRQRAMKRWDRSDAAAMPAQNAAAMPPTPTPTPKEDTPPAREANSIPPDFDHRAQATRLSVTWCPDERYRTQALELLSNDLEAYQRSLANFVGHHAHKPTSRSENWGEWFLVWVRNDAGRGGGKRGRDDGRRAGSIVESIAAAVADG